MTAAILFIGIVLFLGQVFSSLFEKTRLPDVLPLMVLAAQVLVRRFPWGMAFLLAQRCK